MAANDLFLCTPPSPNDVKLYDPAVGCGGGGSTAWTQSLSDSITLNDSLIKSTGLFKFDSITLNDAITKAAGRNISDSVTLNDNIVKGFGRAIADSIALSDLLSKGIGLSYADLITLSDLITLPSTPVTPPTPGQIIVNNFVDLLEMKRREIRSFIQSGVNDMNSVEFGSGLITDFNSIRNHQYPAVWQNIKPVSVNIGGAGSSSPLDTWDIELTIGQKDAMDSSPEQYEDLIDNCDEIAQKLTYKYRNIVGGYKIVTLEDFSRTPFVKKYADCITGVVLAFKMIVPDKTNVC